MMYIEKLHQVLDMLEDDKSKIVYDKKIDYLLNGNKDRLREIVNLCCPEMLPLREDEFEEAFLKVDRKSGVILFGAGSWAKITEQQWRGAFGDDILFFVDNNKEKWGKRFSGIMVCSPNEIAKYPNSNILISTINGVDEIKQWLVKNGVAKNRIHVIPEAGRISKNQYFEDGIIKLHDGEVFLDIGCCNMDTTMILKSKCQTKKVFAFEPDEKNVKKCKQVVNDMGWRDVEILPYGAWDSDGCIRFIMSGNSCSRVADEVESNSSIQTRKIDSVIPSNTQVTFIKMDIEGAEMEALRGAENVIRRCHPKLAISIYHSENDMASIPLWIKSINSEYKLYVRHYSNEPTETVLYAI